MQVRGFWLVGLFVCFSCDWYICFWYLVWWWGYFTPLWLFWLCFLICNRLRLAEICPAQNVCITMLQRLALLACEPQKVCCVWNIKCMIDQPPSVHTCSSVWEITIRNSVTAPNWRQSCWYSPSKQCGFTKATQNEIAGCYYAMHVVLFISNR